MTALPATLKAPFPYFGGKSRAASLVWERLGDTPNYVEPFFGSGAVLLSRPHPGPRTETVNDADGLLCNVWRAIKADPDAVARWADDPPSELDLHARHLQLLARRDALTERLIADPGHFDARLAGWWVWGACCWIGSGWCSGDGPWALEDGRLVKGASEAGGIHRQLPLLGGSRVSGVGVHSRAHTSALDRNTRWMRDLADRLRLVRVACGDWSRVCTPSVTWRNNLTGVFLDPPYGADNAIEYAGGGGCAEAVRSWCADNGDNPRLRIALCGYAGGGHEALERRGWTVQAWKARGGYGSQSDGAGRANARRERVWFSPHCLSPAQGVLF